MAWRIDQWKNGGVSAAEAFDAAMRLRGPAGRRDLRHLPAPARGRQRARLRRPAAAHHGALRALPRRAGATTASRWQYVLVDEYQDTNRVQYELVQQLAGEHRNLCVVGDPDQSIYAWRGADIRNILDFERDYPDAQVVRLERNYRSTRPILEGASGVIGHNLARKEKALFTEREGGEPIEVYEALDDRDEAQYVVRRILGLAREEGRPYGDFAIFYRTNAQSRSFEEELLKYDDSVRRGGRRALLRPGGGEGRARLPAPAAEPGGRRGAAPHRQQAGARHRTDHAGARRGAGRRSGARACWRGCGGSPGGRRLAYGSQRAPLLRSARRTRRGDRRRLGRGRHRPGARPHGLRGGAREGGHPGGGSAPREPARAAHRRRRLRPRRGRAARRTIARRSSAFSNRWRSSATSTPTIAGTTASRS